MASIPCKRINNNSWLKIHYNHYVHVNHDNINSIIIGDSIVVGLTRYNNVWKNLFVNGFINLGIRGDRVEHVLWWVVDTGFPQRLKNNINKDPPMILFKDWLPLVHHLKTGSITLIYLFVDYFNAMNAFLLIKSLIMKWTIFLVSNVP